jgi:hypothetical protein
MKQKRLLVLVVAAPLVGFACRQAAPEPKPAPAPAQVREEVRSIDLVAKLKTWTEVLPPKADGPGFHHAWNKEAPVPPQCYTKTDGVYNPCYVCHQNALPGRENQQNDGSLQEEYAFSDVGLTNHWKNLFEDRSARVAAISDEAITAYVMQDNYTELGERLRAADFRGWIPDIKNLAAGPAAFDDEGFAKDGSWWVAFSYKPLPSTFWPTNGSTDDVMIRLPAKFYTTKAGKTSREVYKANLAILEAALKGRTEMPALPFDEASFGVDLDGNRRIGPARRVVRPERYVGAASDVAASPSLYPEGTEFLHTVRYIGTDRTGRIFNAPRMKEVRYMVKVTMMPPAQLGSRYDEEFQDKKEGNLPRYHEQGSGGHAGIYNKMGWNITGFIEAFDGRLRYTTYEERLACIGCHNTVGSTIDKTFAFPRKVDGPRGWRYIDLRGMPDAPNLTADGRPDDNARASGAGEFLTYLRRVGGGTEFRSNPEMQAKWYRADGTLDEARVRAARDVYELVTPSRTRALLLNKAYKAIVEDQDFIFGRDATVTPPVNVFAEVNPKTAPTLPPERRFAWNIVLDWEAPRPHTALRQ